MDAPTDEQIKRLKEAHADRQLHQVELKDQEADAETFYCVMKGPNSDEYKRYCEQILAVRESQKGEVEKSEKLRFTAKNAVKDLTVWPEKDDFATMLHAHPGFVGLLAEKIHEHAGSSAEVRSKKL